MVRLLSVWTLVFGLMLSSSVAVAGQIKDAVSRGEDVDIAAITDLVLETDPDLLLDGLETPPDDRDLPDGFFNPPSGVPANAEVIEAFTVPIDDLDGAIGSFSPVRYRWNRNRRPPKCWGHQLHRHRVRIHRARSR